ncbi:MAG: DUF2442 domain-containing protein [Chloroflexota bacterium]|nr:DUF2442 domain-containing protein [Chloroflexota bacterium]MDE3103350.1 DUF2442 domain-containing protein [Chloroflexota bacterium]
MSGSATDRRLATAVGLDFHDSGFRVRLSDGRCLEYSFDDFAFLRTATPKQRATGVVDDKGTVLWWESLLEGISVAGITGVSESELEDFAGVYR